jgi:hypothetical protein
MSLICKFAGHKVDRTHVWNDGLDPRTSCRRCDTPLVRDQQGWRPFDRELDFDINRKRKPERSR